MDHSVGLLDRNPRATNFSRSRRPALAVQATPIRKEPAPVVVEQPTRPLLTLLGAIAGDEDGIAILVDEATKNVVRMKTGEKFSGWMLSPVGKRSATFQMARQVAVLVIPIPGSLEKPFRDHGPRPH